VQDAEADMTVSSLAVILALVALAACVTLVLAAAGLKRPRYRRRSGAAH
jgi:hypothetical protein